MTGDSRCPTGATCVWAGEVTFILEITHLDNRYILTINQMGLNRTPGVVVFQGYEITYNVEPYPELNKESKADDYRLQLVIERNQ